MVISFYGGQSLPLPRQMVECQFQRPVWQPGEQKHHQFGLPRQKRPGRWIQPSLPTTRSNPALKDSPTRTPRSLRFSTTRPQHLLATCSPATPPLLFLLTHRHSATTPSAHRTQAHLPSSRPPDAYLSPLSDTHSDRTTRSSLMRRFP